MKTYSAGENIRQIRFPGGGRRKKCEEITMELTLEQLRGLAHGALEVCREEDGLIRLRLSTKPGCRWKLNYLFLNCLKGY